ncbi:MAG: hypothetical protein ACEQSD_06620 [Flavobacteriales bacterium]
MQKRIACLIICSSILAACSNPLSSSKAECNDEASRQLVAETLAKSLNQTGLANIKAMITDKGVDVDLVKFKAAVQQIKFELTDVRTDRADPQSSKKFCQAMLTVNLPSSLLKDADTAREMYQEMTLPKLAILSDLELDNSSVRHQLEYSVQPTDDGQKIYAELQNAAPTIEFVNQVILDALQKPARLAERRSAEQFEQQAAQEQEQLAADQAALDTQQAIERQANQQAYQNLQQQEAVQRLSSANNKLNAVWNSTSKPVRDQLLAEQRIWLKKRELECRLNSEDAAPELRDIARLRCETDVTTQRVGVLQQLIARAEAEQPMRPNNAAGAAAGPAAMAARAAPVYTQPAPVYEQPAGKSASDLATERAAAENAAKFAENVRQLERQLRNQ